MKKIRIIVSVLLTFALVCSLAACKESENDGSGNAAPKALCFDESGEFKIIQMSDFHEWMGIEKKVGIDYQDELKPLLVSFIRDVLSREKPDLVVLTGDNIFSLSWTDSFMKTGIKTYEAIAEIFESEKQYWTLTFGNHDSESAANKDDFLKAVEGYSYFIGGIEDGENYKSFVFSRKDEDGEEDDRYGNFSIPVYSQNGDVLYNVFLLDSGSYNFTAPEGKPYRYILDEQVEWYTSEVNRLKSENGYTVPSVMFTHIPLLEFIDAYREDEASIGDWWGISPSNVRSEIVAKAIENGDVRGIFCGHNHANSFTGFYEREGKKLMLGVTPAAQADSYSDTTSVMRCRRIILTSDGKLSTAILTSDTAEFPDGVEYGEVLSY